MAALVVSLAALVVLAGLTWLPARDKTAGGMAELTPGLLTVAPQARGIITLGADLTVAMQPSGLRIADGDDVRLDSVTRGSPVTAVLGSVTDHDETIRHTYRNARIDRLEFGDGHARWFGTVYDDEGASRPLALDATRQGRTVRVDVSVPGADALALHLDVRANTRGVPPALPFRNLRLRGWWTSGPSVPLFTNVLRAEVGLDAGSAARAVDLRPNGRLVVHAWTDHATLVVRSLPAGAAVPDSRHG